MQAAKGQRSQVEASRTARVGRRERSLMTLVDLMTDIHYADKVDRRGRTTSEWLAGSIAGLGASLAACTSTETCWTELVHADDAAVVRARHERLFAGKRSIDEFRVTALSGIRWLRVYGQPERSTRTGRIVRIVGAAQDISEHKDIESALRKSEQRFRDIVESSMDWVWETDHEHRFTFFSTRLREVLGAGDGYWLGKRRQDIVLEAVPPSDLEAHLEDLRAHRPFSNFTYWTEAMTGRRCVSISGKPVFDAGVFRGYRGTGTDITERKQAEERQTLLLAELNHRIKNTLAVVGSLLRQTRRASRTPEEFEAAFTGRIHAMARAHGLLTQNRWTGSGLRELILQVLAPYQEHRGRIVVHGRDEVKLKPQAAMTLSMAMHELATNAMKYGALSTPEGQVEVRWHVETMETPARLTVEWRETGGPPAAAPTRRGFGSTLIERGVSYELSGQAILDFTPDGLRCHMNIPLMAEIGTPVRLGAP